LFFLSSTWTLLFNSLSNFYNSNNIVLPGWSRHKHIKKTILLREKKKEEPTNSPAFD